MALNNAELVIGGFGQLPRAVGDVQQDMAKTAPVSPFQKALVQKVYQRLANGEISLEQAKMEFAQGIGQQAGGGLNQPPPQSQGQTQPAGGLASSMPAPQQPAPQQAAPPRQPLVPRQAPVTVPQGAHPAVQRAAEQRNSLNAQPQPQPMQQRASLSNPNALPEPQTQRDMESFNSLAPHLASARNTDVRSQTSQQNAQLRAQTQIQATQMRGNTQAQVASARIAAQVAIAEFNQGAMDERQYRDLVQGVENLNATLAQRDRAVAAMNSRNAATLDAKADLALVETRRKIVSDMRGQAARIMASGMQMADPNARATLQALGTSITSDADVLEQMIDATAQNRGVPQTPEQVNGGGVPPATSQSETSIVRGNADGPAPRAAVVAPKPAQRKVQPAAGAPAPAKPATGGKTTPGGKPYAKKMYSASQNKTYFVDASGKPVEVMDGQH